MPRGSRAQGAGARAAKCPGGARAGRATGDRGGVLLRIDACRSRGAVESASRHRQDAHPFRTAQASAGAERGGELSMSSTLNGKHCDQAELVSAYALHALPSSDVGAVEAHLSSCPQCRRELDMLRPLIDSFVSWPTDLLRPAASLQERLARRIAAETGGGTGIPPPPAWSRTARGGSARPVFCDPRAGGT